MLIIEDGTGNPDADSFATTAELAEYAERFGKTVPPDDPAREALLRRAALQMDSFNWKGRKAVSGQGLSWPRKGVHVDDEALPDDAIPARIKRGQMALAIEAHADDLDPPDKRVGGLIKERVEGAVDVQYAELPVGGLQSIAALSSRPSEIQFADYLEPRGLFATRA